MSPSDKDSTGIIFDIKRFAINDGPGIRTTIFFKGCPLSCRWCHNPESVSGKVEKMYSAQKCIGCETCVAVCPEGACEMTKDGIVTDAALCTVCGTCADICPAKATEMSGRRETVDSLMAEVEKDIIFFDQSGGGVTFSGGEPLRQARFLIALLDACGERGIHRTIDTSGFARTETLLEVAKRADHFLFDLKMMDSARHEEYTGVPNEKIIHNLERLAESGASIEIRIPLIKGVNDDDENIERTAVFVAGLAGGGRRVDLLPYHNVACSKYEKLGKTFDENGMAEPDKDRQAAILAALKSAGIPAVLHK